MKGWMEKREKVFLEQEKEGEEEDTLEQEVVNLPTDQRYFIEALERLGKKDAKGDLPIFLRKMDADVVVDWIEALNNHFQCENIAEKDKVKIAKSKLKGPTLTWWNFTPRERVKEDKNMITSWERMCAKVRETYLPKDNEIQLHQRRQSLRQKQLDVTAYTEEFQKLSLRAKQSECESVKVARYLNGLRLNIQEELNLLCLDIVPKMLSASIEGGSQIEKKARTK